MICNFGYLPSNMDKKKTRIVLRHPKSMQTEINSMVSKKEIKKSFMDKKDFINRL